MKLYHYISIIAFIPLMFSCQESEEMVIVADEIKIHFDQFENEAELRNQTIDLEALNLNGQIVQIDSSKVVGQSIVEGSKITIKVDPDYWESADHLQRELLIFHELGHAVLQREHNDSRTEFKECKSIMRSSSSVCKCTYNKSTRTEYINELFN